MVWQRCVKGCVFRTPDGHEQAALPPSRPRQGVSAANRDKPSHRVYDAVPQALNECANNQECRCYIIVQRIVNKGPDLGKVDTETYYPADGDAEGALTEAKVRDYNNEAKDANHHWRFEFVAACLQLILDTDPNTHEKKFRPKGPGE
jgi:hypothetical protein